MFHVNYNMPTLFAFFVMIDLLRTIGEMWLAVFRRCEWPPALSVGMACYEWCWTA